MVTYNNERVIEACLNGLRVALENSSGRLTVVDNASTDATETIVAQLSPTVRLVRNQHNLGFARGANRAALGADADFVLLVNPDVVLDPGAVDFLLAVAHRFPEAGIYGGQAVLVTGGTDPFSCLPAPTLASALAFAIGLPVLRWRLAQLRSARVRASSRVRRVDALCAAFMLITADVWQELGGFDERFFLYGEDVDFCQRARQLGYIPLQATAARYVHGGGASSSSADRHRLLLTGQSTLYRLYLQPWPARAALTALTVGTGLRAGAAAVTGSRHAAHWRDVWRERSRWCRGWPDVDQRRRS